MKNIPVLVVEGRSLAEQILKTDSDGWWFKEKIDHDV